MGNYYPHFTDKETEHSERKYPAQSHRKWRYHHLNQSTVASESHDLEHFITMTLSWKLPINYKIVLYIQSYTVATYIIHLYTSVFG